MKEKSSLTFPPPTPVLQYHYQQNKSEASFWNFPGLIGMEVKFMLGLVFLFLSYRWNDSFPGTSVRHLSIALVLSPSGTVESQIHGSGEWEGRYILRKHFNFMWGLAGRRPERALDLLIPYRKGPNSVPRTPLGRMAVFSWGSSHLCRKPAGRMDTTRYSLL